MEVRAAEITYAGHGGDPVRAARFAPAELDGLPRAGIVLAHEVYGLDGFARHAGERLARAGHVVLAPDLYSREGPPGPAPTPEDPAPVWSREEIRRALADLPDRRAVGDLAAAAARLAEDADVAAERIGVVGSCAGGTLAFLLACQSRRIAAAVDFYGRVRYDELGANHPVQPLEMALNLGCPLLAVFGAADESIPIADVEAMGERLDAFAKPVDLVVVPGAGHGFLNCSRRDYRPDEAREAWSSALAFLEEHLV